MKGRVLTPSTVLNLLASSLGLTKSANGRYKDFPVILAVDAAHKFWAAPKDPRFGALLKTLGNLVNTGPGFVFAFAAGTFLTPFRDVLHDTKQLHVVIEVPKLDCLKVAQTDIKFSNPHIALGDPFVEVQSSSLSASFS